MNAEKDRLELILKHMLRASKGMTALIEAHGVNVERMMCHRSMAGVLEHIWTDLEAVKKSEQPSEENQR